MTGYRAPPIPVILRGGPLDGQTRNLWPHRAGQDLELIDYDALREGVPGIWLLRYQPTRSGEYRFDGFDWRDGLHDHGGER